MSLFVLIAALFMFFINDAVEAAWGSFRLNVYVISTIFCLTCVGLLIGSGQLLVFVFYSSVFLAFASLYPEQIIHLMMIIPIKAKWLGWANVFMIGAVIATSSPGISGRNDRFDRNAAVFARVRSCILQ